MSAETDRCRHLPFVLRDLWAYPRSNYEFPLSVPGDLGFGSFPDIANGRKF